MSLNNSVSSFRKRLLGLLVLFSMFKYSYGQTHIFNGWLVSSHQQELNKKWSLLTDFQLRSADRFKYLQTFLFRPAIKYSFDQKNSVALGYAYLGNWEREAAEKTFEPEQRIWEQFMKESSLGSSELTNRLRLEQRFLTQDGTPVFAQRLRHFVRLQAPLKGNGQEFKKGLFIGLQNEVFLNIQNKEVVNNKFFDQNRLSGAIGYRLSAKVDLDGGYLYRYQIEEQKMHNHIIQLNITTSF